MQTVSMGMASEVMTTLTQLMALIPRGGPHIMHGSQGCISHSSPAALHGEGIEDIYVGFTILH